MRLVSLFQSFKLYFGHLRNSKRIILISAIGLIFALTIISSSFLYVDTTRSVIIDNVLNTQNNSNYDLTFNFQVNSPKVNVENFQNTINTYSNDLVQKLNLNIFSKLELFCTATNFYMLEKGGPLDAGQAVNNSVVVVQLNNALRQDLTSFLSANSTLPQVNRTIQQAFALQTSFLKPDSPALDFYQHNSVLNSSVQPIYLGISINTQIFSINVTGYGNFISTSDYNSNNGQYIPNYQSGTYPALSQLWKNGFQVKTYIFVNNLTRLLSHVQFDHFKHYGVDFNAFGGYKIDTSKIDPYFIAEKTNEISRFQYALQNSIINSAFFQSLYGFTPSIVVDFQTYSLYHQIGSMTTTVLFNMLLYALPVLIIALLTTNYSFNLIHKNILRLIGIYKTRGASKYLLFFFEGIDFFIIIFTALIFGAILGLPLTSLVSKTSFLLTFNNQNNYNVIGAFLDNFIGLMQILIVFAVSFSILVNLRRTLRHAKMTITETEYINENQDPYWKRHYLDILLFFYGLVSYAIITFITSNASYAENIGSSVNLFLYLLIPSPFAITVGIILVANRLTPYLIDKIGTTLWHRNGSLLAFSFKNIIRNKRNSTRAIMLVSTLLTFLLLFFALPYSQVIYQQRVSLYSNGAEGLMTVQSYDQYNVTALNKLIKNISTTLEANFSNSLTGFSPYFTSSKNDPKLGTEYFIFINSTSYAQGSAIRQFKLGLTKNFENDLASLHTTNNSVLVNKKAFDERLLSIGQNLTVPIGENDYQEFPIIDTFTNWPSTTRYSGSNNLVAILDMNNFVNSSTGFLNTPFARIDSFGFYLNFKNGINQTATAQSISKMVSQLIPASVRVSNSELKNWDIYNLLIFEFQIGQININIIMSVVIGITVLIMFSYMQLNDRKYEIYTERALGMKIKQLLFLFFTETMILLFTSFIVGTLMGLFFVQMIIVFMTGGTQIPSYDVVIPWNYVLVVYLVLFFLSILSTLIFSYFISKQDISNSFGQL